MNPTKDFHKIFKFQKERSENSPKRSRSRSRAKERMRSLSQHRLSYNNVMKTDAEQKQVQVYNAYNLRDALDGFHLWSMKAMTMVITVMSPVYITLSSGWADWHWANWPPYSSFSLFHCFLTSSSLSVRLNISAVLTIKWNDMYCTSTWGTCIQSSEEVKVRIILASNHLSVQGIIVYSEE